MFVLGCLPPYEHVCVCQFVRAYLSASCVRVSMLAFKRVHARMHEVVCVSPSVRHCLSVYPRACSCVQQFDCTCVHSSMHAFVCLHARSHVGVCLSPSIRPSVCLSVRVHVRVSNCLFAHACVHHFMRDISYF